MLRATHRFADALRELGVRMRNRFATAVAVGIGLVFALACGGSSIDTSMWVVPTSGGTTVCPSDGSSGSGWSDCTRVVLLAINGDDPYAGSEWEAQIPIHGTVQGDLHNNGDCWFGGGFLADDGTDFYFYKAAFKAE